MAFQQETNLTKDEIGDFEIVLFVPQTITAETPQAGSINVQIVLSDGSIKTRSFNLLDRLQDDAAGQAHLSNLASLRDYVRDRLVAEVLP